MAIVARLEAKGSALHSYSLLPITSRMCLLGVWSLYLVTPLSLHAMNPNQGVTIFKLTLCLSRYCKALALLDEVLNVCSKPLIPVTLQL